ncbi:hypothetical protein BDN72DRAFT_906572 [Pluteus cervinus]|uniref:Uncharacterized protein n=1 Tax=Pluteus cervinus TaxID=181527 RepID=A0ACD2ZZQ1_9AGAR|nr:hypothetical protein BDN72DRAFT_906572 [Pluteus cervinus]
MSDRMEPEEIGSPPVPATVLSNMRPSHPIMTYASVAREVGAAFAHAGAGAAVIQMAYAAMPEATDTGRPEKFMAISPEDDNNTFLEETPKFPNHQIIPDHKKPSQEVIQKGLLEQNPQPFSIASGDFRIMGTEAVMKCTALPFTPQTEPAVVGHEQTFPTPTTAPEASKSPIAQDPPSVLPKAAQVTLSLPSKEVIDELDNFLSLKCRPSLAHMYPHLATYGYTMDHITVISHWDRARVREFFLGVQDAIDRSGNERIKPIDWDVLGYCIRELRAEV